ncbi:hypothetical protein JCM10449v2_007501 [Rhodotorula kratochvilovae]
MSTSPSTVYLVTGANRGLGLGLVTALAQRSDALVFATARDPSRADALHALAKETGRVIVLQLEATSAEDARAAAEVVKEKAGRVDVVIANAALPVTNGLGPLLTTSPSSFEAHFRTNTLGALVLFQAFHALLLASPPRKRQFVAVSSLAGSLATRAPFPASAYGTSKAALNYLVTRIALEHGASEGKDAIAAYAIHPGMVGTGSGVEAAEAFGLPREMLASVEESVRGVLGVVDAATAEKDGGKFLDHERNELPW